jgi:murein DD-endopeptidase MepM/ murein hydrolase activator NlpD
MPTQARWRALSVLVASAVAVPLTFGAPAAAEDLEGQRREVSQAIDRRTSMLDESTERLVAATQRQQAAESQLAAAQEELSRTRGELAVAQAYDARMQDRLDEAVAELRRARQQLSTSRARIRSQEDQLGQIALESYQSGDPGLMALSMVLNTQDAQRLGGRLGAVQSILDRETVTRDRLEASRVLLEVQEDQLREARAEVARRRAAARENLQTKQQLEARAEEMTAQVEDLAVERAAARDAAAAARTQDARVLQELESERARISDLLRQRAEEARAAALAAARERREAREAAARAREEALAAARAQRERARQAREAAPAPAPEPRTRPAPKPEPNPAPRRPAPFSLLTPVSGYLTSSYGMRFHPVYHRWSLHDGTDWGAACGTPIRAAAAGTVLETYAHSAYGNRVIVDHGYKRGVGLATTYNHLSSYATYPGEHVQRGEVIGYVGSTGYSTGCHLHFMVLENGQTVDPMTWL